MNTRNRVKVKKPVTINKPSRAMKLRRGTLQYVADNYGWLIVTRDASGKPTGKTFKQGVSRQAVYKELRKGQYGNIQMLRLALRFQILCEEADRAAGILDQTESETTAYIRAIVDRASEIETIVKERDRKLSSRAKADEIEHRPGLWV